MSERRGSAGFTLLEMLVALAVFGLVVVTLSGGVRFAGRAVVAEERLIDGYAEVEPVRNLIRRLVGDARAISGTADTLELTAPLPAALGAEGLFDIRLGTQGEHLIIEWQAHHAPGAATGRAALIDGVSGLTFSYLDFGSGWRPSTRKDQPPLLVRIELGFGNARQIDLIAAPGTDLSFLTRN
jgi:general secretion pathway protein J